MEKVAKFLGKGIEETVTEDDIVKIAVSRDGLRKCVDEREYRVLLNKADIPGKAEAAERIAGKLEQQRVHVVWGSLQKEYYNSCDFAREKITLVMLAQETAVVSVPTNCCMKLMECRCICGHLRNFKRQHQNLETVSYSRHPV